MRWLIGEALRRLPSRAELDSLRAVAPDRRRPRLGPRTGLPASEIALHARDKLRAAEEKVGPAAWPILTRVVIEGASLRDCRGLCRIARLARRRRARRPPARRLDRLGEVVGVAAGRR